MSESRFNRSSWVALGASVLLILTALLVNTYRYTLPTDGWAFDYAFRGLTANALGLPSAIQQNDIVVSLEGIPVEEIIRTPNSTEGALPGQWRAGQLIQYTIRRGDQTMPVPVPIGNWNFIALWKLILANWSGILIGLLSFLIGMFVFIRRPGNLAAQVLLFLGTVQLVMSLTVIPVTLADFGDAFAKPAGLLLGNYIWGILLFPTLLLLSLVFPNPKWPFRTHPPLTLACLYLLEPVLVLFIGGPAAKAGPYVGFGLVAVYGLLTVISVIHTLITERSDVVARAQTKWVGLGVALVAGFQFLENTVGISMMAFLSNEVNLSPWWENLIQIFVYLALPITIAIAILRYRLFDIDVIIRKTLVFSTLTAILALVFFGGVALLQQVVGRLTGTEDSPVVIVISTLLIAALFSPLRRRIQDFIDRRFYRQKYNAEQALEDFAETARNETDLEALTGKLVEVVSQTMQPDQVNVWLAKPGRR
jgi:hypothetical protein